MTMSPGCLLPALVAIALASPAGAEPLPYRVDPQNGKPGVTLEMPYTFGTHRETVTAVTGEILLDPVALEVAGGELVVPLDAIRSGDATRGCHLRSSLGLDYARSRFPGEHVCDDRDRLPAEGPDAIAFREVRIDVTGARPRGDPGVLAQGRPVSVDVEGRLTIHGVTRPLRLELEVSRDAAAPGALRVRGRLPVKLADHGVVVKSARVLLVTVSAGEQAAAVIDARLVPVAR
jgi:polyisoprenoid-binding protein YceI